MAGGMSSHLVSTQLALLNHLIRLELCREPGLSFPVARLHYQQLKVLVLSSFTKCVFDTLVDMYFETCVAIGAGMLLCDCEPTSNSNNETMHWNYAYQYHVHSLLTHTHTHNTPSSSLLLHAKVIDVLLRRRKIQVISILVKIEEVRRGSYLRNGQLRVVRLV